jgi:hypothetical protein
MDNERLAAVEEGLRELREGQQRTQLVLDALLARLNNVEVPTVNAPLSLVPPTPSSPPSGERSRSRIKPGVPADFDGNRTKGRAFLNSCDLYMKLCAAEFEDDQARIHWILSYMKGDRAAAFADRTLRYEDKHQRPRFTTFAVFRSTFIEAFCPENESTQALIRLESDRYFQARRNVEAYVDEFETLIDVSGYTDELAIVLKFRRGLNPAIQDKIAESGSDRPDDNSPNAWYAAARRFDQNRLANEAFNSASNRRTTANPSIPTTTSRTFSSRNPFAHLSPPSAISQKTSQTLPPGIPMDIDASRARQTPQNCYRCAKTGHIAKDCPLRFDIRHMTFEERDTLLEDLMAAKDAVPAMSERDSQEGTSVTEDFQSRSE